MRNQIGCYGRVQGISAIPTFCRVTAALIELSANNNQVHLTSLANNNQMHLTSLPALTLSVSSLAVKSKPKSKRCLDDRLDHHVSSTFSGAPSFSRQPTVPRLCRHCCASPFPMHRPNGAVRSIRVEPTFSSPCCPGHRLDTFASYKIHLQPPAGTRKNTKCCAHLLDLLSRLRQNPDDPARHRRRHSSRRFAGRRRSAPGRKTPRSRDG